MYAAHGACQFLRMILTMSATDPGFITRTRTRFSKIQIVLHVSLIEETADGICFSPPLKVC